MEPECCPKCEKIVYDAEGFPAGKEKSKTRNTGCPNKFWMETLKKIYQNRRNKNFEIFVLKKIVKLKGDLCQNVNKLSRLFSSLVILIDSWLNSCPKPIATPGIRLNFSIGGRRFHKKCFKCFNASCSKKLDSNNVRVHGSQLYCKVCVDKLDPSESPKIYTDVAKISPGDDKGCPR